MQLQRFIDALKADLSVVAELGDESTAEASSRIVFALQASVGMRLLDALSEAALELNERLPAGHVEVRLSGQDPELVFVSDEREEPAAAATGDEAYTARITLRLPENLKSTLEESAAREGVSVNTWIVRALTRSSAGPSASQSRNRLTGYAQG